MGLVDRRPVVCRNLAMGFWVPLHWGCFVWTLTPLLAGRRTPRLGTARVCVRVLCLAGSGGPASWACSGAPHLFLWPLCPSSLFGVLRAFVALFAVFFFSSLCAPSLFRVLRPGVPWALASCSPPPFYFRPPLFFCSLVFCSLRFVCCFFFCSVCCFFFFVFSFFAGCAVRCRFVFLWLWVVLVCGAVGAAVCGALCVFPGAVWRACAWLGFRALRSGAVLRLVLLGCFFCVLLSRAAVFPAGFFFLALFRVFPWWSLLFWSVWCSAVVCLAVCRGPVALRSCAGFCCAVPFGPLPCLGASLGSVLCCLFRCGAWVASCLVRCCGVLLCSVCPWARCWVVLPRCLWSVCCRSLCRVSGRLLCGAVLLCLCPCSLCGALSPLWRWLVLCVVACCVRVCAVGLGCPLLSPGGSRCRVSVVLSLSGRVARRPVVLVWCVWVLRSAVLCSVVLCCRVVVCCCALLSVCVVACACCLFPGAALSAVCVLVCFTVVGRLVVAPCSPVLCPVALCCRVVLRCRVLVSFCGAVCACRRIWCRVLVVLSLSGRVARRPVFWCGVSGCSAPLCCVLWCCAVAWWCAVVPCCLFASLPVPVVCFLALCFLLCVS